VNVKLNEMNDGIANARLMKSGDDDDDDDDDTETGSTVEEVHLFDYFTEPFVNRWDRRFESPLSDNPIKYLFFKHIRKAGGTSLRTFFFTVLEYHDQSRTFDLSPVAAEFFESGAYENSRGGEFRKGFFENKKAKTQKKNQRRGRRGRKDRTYEVHYVEQEFDAMDWQCPSTDPRWKDSLRIITLRHPIERHFSEFFFSGPGQAFKVNKTLLYTNQTYANELTFHINEQFPLWMEETHADPKAWRETQQMKNEVAKKTKQNKLLNPDRTFGRFYTDNFQLRALAGCSSGDCLNEYDDNDAAEFLTQQQLSAMSPPDKTNCTIYFEASELLFDSCHKKYSTDCPTGCDGPCFYNTLTKGPITRKHLERAILSLRSFDAILMMELLDDERQADFLSDLVNVPRDWQYSLKNKQRVSNAGVDKKSRREKTHFYRDLLSKLGLDELGDKLRKENALEIELFDVAARMNGAMLDRWEKENAKEQSSEAVDSDVAIVKESDEATPTPAEEIGKSSGKEEEPNPTAIRVKEKEESDVIETTINTQANDAHDYGVLIVMYHKTGYVLTRRLMKLTIGLEYEARGYSAQQIKQSMKVPGHKVEHIDEKLGIQIAFGQRGNWNRNFVGARKHHGYLGCQSDFQLSPGTIYLQEAPDFFCNDVGLYQRMLGLPVKPPQKSGKTKVVHFVRNPFDMVLSNYFYHSQDPTPEKWVHIDDPCEYNYENGESLAFHVFPTISRKTKITQKQLEAVVTMCQSLYQSTLSMKDATFYEHLRQLNRWDGLQLATAQMIISSSVANKYLAGGDILRMANNLIKFENLMTSARIPRGDTDELHLLTLSMDDYIAMPKNVTAKYLDFVLGSDDAIVSRELRRIAVQRQETGAEKSQSGKHVTQGKHDDKEKLKQSLRDDPVLGPILSEVEILVDQALARSESLVMDR